MDRKEDKYSFKDVFNYNFHSVNDMGINIRVKVASAIVLTPLMFLFCGYTLYIRDTEAMITAFSVLAIVFTYLLTTLVLGDDHYAAIAMALVTLISFTISLLVPLEGLTAMVWVLLVPPIFMILCGLKLGFLVGLYFWVLMALLAFTPIGGHIADQYMGQMAKIIVIIYSFIYSLSVLSTVDNNRKIMRLIDARKELTGTVKRSDEIIRQTNQDMIIAILNTVDAKDNYTMEHSKRVAMYSSMIAEKLGWSRSETEQLYIIALMHDIGKIGIPDRILKKNGRLDKDEYEEVKNHTLIGEGILRDLNQFPKAGVGAATHHERYDGNGYPKGLKGEEIPIEGRIIGIADAFDAMNSKRIYQGRLGKEEILREMRNGSGVQFDPEILKVFLSFAERFMDEVPGD